MSEIIGVLISLALFAYILWRVFTTTRCPYCNSRNIINEYHTIFYCNNCHKKF